MSSLRFLSPRTVDSPSLQRAVIPDGPLEFRGQERGSRDPTPFLSHTVSVPVTVTGRYPCGPLSLPQLLLSDAPSTRSSNLFRGARLSAEVPSTPVEDRGERWGSRPKGSKTLRVLTRQRSVRRSSKDVGVTSPEGSGGRVGDVDSTRQRIVRVRGQGCVPSGPLTVRRSRGPSRPWVTP